jgi:hypothetical protein
MTELIKIGIVFFIILVLAFRKVNLGISLFVSTFWLGFLFYLPAKKIVWDILNSAVDSKTLFFLGAWAAILFFSGLLKETGRMSEILEGFRSSLSGLNKKLFSGRVGGDLSSALVARRLSFDIGAFDRHFLAGIIDLWRY